MRRGFEPGIALRRAYGAVNRGEIEPALSLMCEDVDWPNTIEGGRERGRDAVHAYWTRIFELVVPQFTPLCVRAAPGGRVVVHAQLIFSDPGKGLPLAHQHVRHVFTWREGRIARMDASEPMLAASHGCDPPGCSFPGCAGGVRDLAVDQARRAM
ncbi:MAG: nuclear transport factor 2 family protein [Mycobacteriales bacterium]